jgi:hypothetical protein
MKKRHAHRKRLHHPNHPNHPNRLRRHNVGKKAAKNVSLDDWGIGHFTLADEMQPTPIHPIQDYKHVDDVATAQANRDITPIIPEKPEA